METGKEILLFVATTIVSVGAVIINTHIWQGVALLVIGAAIFVGRGYYKKYLSDERAKKIVEHGDKFV